MTIAHSIHKFSDAVAGDLARLDDRGAVGLLNLWQRRIRTRRALAAMDPRLLADIGLTPDEARHEVCRPFWEPVRPHDDRR